MPRILAGTARRLRLTMAVLVVGLVGASVAALSGLAELHGLLHAVKHREVDVRTVMSLATAVRDLYAHQAHTILLGNTSHLPLYDDAAREVERSVAAVLAQDLDPGEREGFEGIRDASREIDAIFRQRLVPAVMAKDTEAAMMEHGRILDLVTDVQNRADALTARHERSIAGFEAHARAVQHAAVVWTIAFSAASILLGLGVSAWIGHSVTRPLKRLEQGAERLARGDLQTRIDIHSHDEFGRLAAQINRMTTALREDQERLVQSEKLAGIGRLAAGVAHEINNPLGVILGYARVLGRSAPEASREELRIIEEEALRCRDIVDGLLDLARPLKVEPDNVDLRAVVEDVATRLRQSGQAPSADVTVEGSGTVEGSAPRIRQLLANLLKNAAEAAGAQGRVSVRVAETAQRVSITVQDSGPGVPPEALARMFEPFFTTKPQGTGLGLAVSRAIAQAHRGEIRVVNAPSGGAQFVVELPRRRA